MAENTYPVKPIGVEYICDKCQVGRMVYQKLVFSGDMENRKSMFEHKCSNQACGHVQEFHIHYPTIRYITQGAE